MSSKSIKATLSLIVLWLSAVWWLSPSSMAGTNEIQLTSDPDCVSWGANRIDCFARSTDNAIWHTWWDGKGWWAWESLGGKATSGPSVASWGVGHLDVFIRGADNALWHKWTFDPAKGWSDWLPLGVSPGGDLTSDPDCVSRGSNQIECLATMADKAVWRKWYNGATWNPWESLGGAATSGPTAASWAANHLDVFVRWTDNAIWHKYFLGGPWSDWLSLGGVLTSDPDCVAWGQNRIDCFARTIDNAIWHKWFDGNWVTPGESLGGTATSGPSVASWGVGHLDVFIKGTDNALWHKWTFDPAKGWSDWLRISMVYQVTTIKPPPPATVTPSIDMALSNPSVSSPSPKVGDPVTFRAVLTILSTTKPGTYPLPVGVKATVDGVDSASYNEAISYSGPTGSPMTVDTSQHPWTATAGTHTAVLEVWMYPGVPAPGVVDPDASNNKVSLSFTVLAATATFQFDYRILVSPKEQAVTPGASAVYTVSVNLIAGPAQDVALSLSGPADMMAAGLLSGTFNPPLGKPDPAFSSTLTITAASSVSPGRFSMTVTGNGGGRTHTATLDLVILESPDFRVDVGPASQTASQGETVSYSVSVVGLGGFSSAVSLEVSGLPSGLDWRFSALSGVPNYSSTLTVGIPSDAATGSFTLTITGTGGGLTKVANVVLIVNPSTVTPPTSTSTSTTGTGGGPGGPPDLTWITIGILAVIVILLVAVALRRRKPAPPAAPPSAQAVPPTPASESKPSSLFCTQCGAENPVTYEFCGKCGEKLSHHSG